MAKRQHNNDREVELLITSNPNMLVPWYLMAGYHYYELDESFISDDLFDRICKRLVDEWDTIEHRHKFIIDKNQLAAGTAYYIDWKTVPEIIKGAATAVLKHGVQIQDDEPEPGRLF
jgi:hypothetical protein